MPAKDQFKLLVKEFVQPKLNQHQFRKKGMVFWREDEACISAIEIILGEYNSIEKMEFTMEAGIYFPSVVAEIIKIPRFAFIGKPKIPPNDSTFQLSARIGDLSGRGDEWWKVSDNSNIQSIGTELEENIDKRLLPWLDYHRKISESIDRLKEKAERKDLMSAVYLLGLAKEVGQQEVCDFALKMILANSLIKGKDRNDIKAWAKSNASAIKS